MSAADQCRKLGIDLKAYDIGKHRATCPQCSHLRKAIHQHDACLAVAIDSEAVLWHCHNCGWQGHVWNEGQPEISRTSSPRAATGERPPDPRALELWSAAHPAHGTIVETYLASRRLTAPAGDEVLRFHPRCPFKLDDDKTVFLPSMIGLFRDIVTDKPVAIHRTALAPDGSGKSDHPGFNGRPKWMLGPAGGCAIKIDADETVTMGLHIGEGIETCLSARQLGYRPVWALGSVGPIGKFPVLSGIEAITLLEEDDQSGANAKAVAECAKRWLAAGKEVFALRPIHGGDANDALTILLQKSSANGQSPSPGVVEELPSACFPPLHGERRHSLPY